MAKEEPTPVMITEKVGLAEDSLEAVTLEGEKVKIYLKSGSIIENKCIDEIHAQIRYDRAFKALKKGAGYTDSSELNDMEDYIKEISKEDSSSSGK